MHGTLVSSAQWVNYPRLLGPDVEVVTPDLPGHGTRSATRFTFDGAVETIGAAVGGTSLPVLLAGHSLGGYLASARASVNSAQLTGLALLGAAGDPSSPLAHAYGRATGLFQRIGIPRMDRMANRHLARIVPPDTIDALRGAGVSYASVPDAWPVVLREIRPELLDSVDCPVLFIGGQFDQMRIHTRRYLGHTRDAQIVVIPRGTHMFPLTHQQLTAAALRRFIDRLLTA